MDNKLSKISDEEKKKRILTIVKYMENKWKNKMVEIMNDFEYVNYPGDMDFMSNIREYIIIVENMLRKDKKLDLQIKEEKFIENGLPVIRYSTENASVKFAYSGDKKLAIPENESYYIKIEWIELDYNLD